MIVKNLAQIAFSDIIDCFLEAFEGYYVPMPTNEEYYRQRWKAAKVDFNYSYGMFDDGKLVGFIIHGVDNRTGRLTAFNTGTGVIPAYRGKRIIKKIYEHAIPELQKHGIERIILEVIKENAIAVKSYESIGFKIHKNYSCFSGVINSNRNADKLEIEKVNLDKIDWDSLPHQHHYSWDFMKETIVERAYECYFIKSGNDPVSYFIINPENTYVAQFDVLHDTPNAWQNLFSCIKSVSDSVKIINVDEAYTNKMAAIKAAGLNILVEQFEMEMEIKKMKNSPLI